MNIEKEIEVLNNKLIQMADLVVNNLEMALNEYLNYDLKTTIDDDEIDKLERDLEEDCLKILLKERPYAGDLRRISGILKLISDLERLGDHAEDILEFVNKMKVYERKNIAKINDIIKIALNMVKDSIESYINQDINLANLIIKKDDSVDLLYNEILDEIILMLDNNNCSSSFAIYSTLVVKYIERIADHAVNIAEWVIYIANGFHKDKKIF